MADAARDLDVYIRERPVPFYPWLRRFAWERLVDMAKHNYRLEPNVTITPDGKWVVFRSNMHGPTHVYAAEIAKSRAKE